MCPARSVFSYASIDFASMSFTCSGATAVNLTREVPSAYVWMISHFFWRKAPESHIDGRESACSRQMFSADMGSLDASV